MEKYLMTDADRVRDDLDAMMKRLRREGVDFQTDMPCLEPVWREIDSLLITADVCELIGDPRGSEQALGQVSHLLAYILEQIPD